MHLGLIDPTNWKKKNETFFTWRRRAHTLFAIALLPWRMAYSKNWTIMSNPPWAENSLHISSCKYIPEHYTCFFTKPLCPYTHFGWCSEQLSVVDQCDNLPPFFNCTITCILGIKYSDKSWSWILGCDVYRVNMIYTLTARHFKVVQRIWRSGDDLGCCRKAAKIESIAPPFTILIAFLKTFFH